MASALTRAAAAAALRRSATGTTLHRAATLGPQLPRFGRLPARRCYRLSSPAGSDEGSHEGMDRESLPHYAKQVSMDKAELLKGQCQYDPVWAEMNVRNVKNDLQDMSKRIDKVQKSTEKYKDITSVYIRNVGSINVLTIGMCFFTLYQTCGYKFF